ncbi:hypothetical protein HK102_007961 [Quaeritorhiza haematococci]|nr:hypothetical protein HK102_007961 [Quaeritorhiza haematococci]
MRKKGTKDSVGVDECVHSIRNLTIGDRKSAKAKGKKDAGLNVSAPSSPRTKHSAGKTQEESGNTISTAAPSTASSPKVVLHPSGVVVLIFSDMKLMQAMLGRAHVAYEGGELRGPLKGVNFPMEHWMEWVRSQNPAAADDECVAGNDREACEVQSPATSNTGGITDDERRMVQILENCWKRKGGGGTGTKKQHSGSLKKSSFPGTTESIMNPPKPRPPSYIIASLSTDTDTLLHEWAHAIYHLSEHYRLKCHDLWSTMVSPSSRAVLEKELELRGYRADVLVDEFQAYVVEEPGCFGRKMKGELVPVHRALREELPMLSDLLSID